jgi:anti-sigma factor RsiW
MDHTRATELHAAERYLLGELPAEEAEDFELHYFACAECAEAVERGTEFIANARAVLVEGEPQTNRAPVVMRKAERASKQSRWSWPQWVPVAAAVVFAVVALYQGAIVIPGMRQAQPLPAFLLSGLSRGAAATVSVPAGTGWMALSTDLPPDAHFAQYVCILTSDGRAAARVTAGAPVAGQPVTVLVPTRDLAPGDYEFAVYGIDSNGQQRDKVSTSSFHFQFQ